MKNSLLFLVALACCIWTKPASAQLSRGQFRLSLDVDMISVAHVSLDPDGPGPTDDQLVFGIGPNQLGGSRAISGAPTSPIGFGFGWVLTPKILLGIRTGLGYDLISPDGNSVNTKILVVSLMPGIEFVPIGHRAKLFIAARPIFQANRTKQGDAKNRWLQGGFSLGIGTYIFPSPAVSVDLGFFFEGRFGNYKVNDDNPSEHVTDLRGVVRFGLSLWR
jgi:hypothetical protein